LQEIHELLIKADGMILATPSYWYGPTGLMKNFIDRLCSLENNSYLLEGKVVGFIATAEESGGEEAMMSMVEACNEMGMIAPPYSTIFHSTKIKSSWAIRDVSLLGKNLVILAKLLKKVKKSPDWKGKLYWGYPEEYD
jgi:multimeric flavodoxin WrbA